MPKPSVIMTLNRDTGVTKVTLASDIALNLSKKSKVLLIDCNPKGNLANAYFKRKEFELQESFTEERIEVSKVRKNLYILQGSEQLISITPSSTKRHLQYARLSLLLGRTELEIFDYIILDSLTILKYITMCGFISSSQIIIPLISSVMEILTPLLEYIKYMLESYGLNTPVYGIQINQYNESIDKMKNLKLELEESYSLNILDSYYSNNIYYKMRLSDKTESEKLIKSSRQPKCVVEICNEIIDRLKTDKEGSNE